MNRIRGNLIRRGIGNLVKELKHQNAEFDKLLRRNRRFDPKTGDAAGLVRDASRMCAVGCAIHGLEHRIIVARELLIYDVEHRFQFRRRLHVLENGGRKRYDFWKI
jgi:hypothetical protein